MGTRHNVSGLALVMAVATAPLFGQPLPDPAAPACVPGKPLRGPDYPVEMAKRGLGGEVVLDLTLDACGLVVDAVVKQGDKKLLNDAALASVKGVTLTESQRAGARDGHLSLPITFNMKAGRGYQKIVWPTTHRRPRYILDDQAMAYATAAEADASIKAPPDQFWPSPYAVRSRFVQVGDPAAREFWLFVFKNGIANVAVHYRPVMVDGDPVVKLALRCSDTPEACTSTEELLLQGLPFAKARK